MNVERDSRRYEVVLVNAPLSRKRSDWIAPPLGLLYVAAALEAAGATVRVVDANIVNDPVREVAGLAAAGGVVGVSAFTPNYPLAAKMASAMRRLRPDLTMVLGGFHATFAWPDVLSEEAFDAVVLGAGEAPMTALVESIRSGTRRPTPGVIWRDERSSATQTHSAAPAQTIGLVPRPARHLLDFEPYKAAGSSFAGSVQYSRGCLYHCYFCQVHPMEGKWKARDPEDTAREVAEVRESLGLNRFTFVDNLLNGDRDCVLALCEQLRRHARGISWACDARVDGVDRELAREMSAAGCRSVFIGLESGDETTLRAIGKMPDLDLVRTRLRMLREEGIATVGSFVIGFPWEDEQAIRRTIDFAQAAELSFSEFSFATPLPGTRLAADAKKHGAYVLVNDVTRWDGQTPVLVLPRISRRRLVELYLEAIATGYAKGMPNARREVV